MTNKTASNEKTKKTYLAVIGYDQPMPLKEGGPDCPEEHSMVATVNASSPELAAQKIREYFGQQFFAPQGPAADRMPSGRDYYIYRMVELPTENKEFQIVEWHFTTKFLSDGKIVTARSLQHQPLVPEMLPDINPTLVKDECGIPVRCRPVYSSPDLPRAESETF